MSQENTRNFCIIAHIDHGKSTLADRFLELTKTVEQRKMKSQLLDQMDIERERGITIKLQPARMEYKLGENKYILNLIDTPGHVDFAYEVSRSLAAVEGAVLLVDATQGIQAQTLANLYLAMEQDLEIIPVINKIDMPNAMIEEVSKEINDLIGTKKDEIIKISAKTGENVEKVLEEIIKKVSPPKGDENKPVRALIFDSYFDSYKGVIAQVRMIDGKINEGDQIYFLKTKLKSEIIELGVIKPQLEKTTFLEAGDVGYIATGLKEVGKCRVGDTITKYESIFKDEKEIGRIVKPLSGYKEVKPTVFASMYPIEGDEYPNLR
ncbi:GTP-binding protein, partial [Candidatus Parcubacteria bacterium]|nr:GTP-binding protein [Candidatus Parcubacteria bacterium]